VWCSSEAVQVETRQDVKEVRGEVEILRIDELRAAVLHACIWAEQAMRDQGVLAEPHPRPQVNELSVMQFDPVVRVHGANSLNFDDALMNYVLDLMPG
jgi:hypothetical protein